MSAWEEERKRESKEENLVFDLVIAYLLRRLTRREGSTKQEGLSNTICFRLGDSLGLEPKRRWWLNISLSLILSPSPKCVSHSYSALESSLNVMLVRDGLIQWITSVPSSVQIQRTGSGDVSHAGWHRSTLLSWITTAILKNVQDIISLCWIWSVVCLLLSIFVDCSGNRLPKRFCYL